MIRPNGEKNAHKSRQWRNAVTAILLGMSAALLVNSWKIRQEKIAELTGPLSKVSISLNGLGLARINSSLMTDSVLSIVQSYYVDPERVENHDLLRLAVNSLPALVPGSQAGEENGRSWFRFAGKRVEFKTNESLSYESLVDHLGQLGEVLDDGFQKAELSIQKQTKNRVDSDAKNGIAVVLNSMLMSLDAHSNLLSQESYRELRQGTEGAFGGLGVLVGVRDNLLTVIKPLPRSPAVRAGIRRNDKILNINGTDTFGSSLDQLVEHMRGDPGTNVNLSLLRGNASAPVDISLKREVIHVDSVSSTEIRERGLNVLHLVIDSFASRTSREVLSAIKKARRRSGGSLDGLILDMRSNPGGLLDQAVQVADLFLKSGVIVSTRGRREEVERAGKGYDEVDFPMVVLVNGDSASASEIVAGALQDHDRAIVIGQPTFGKGSVQTIFELPEERALKLTIARYYTPAGRSIQNVGIIPDVWLQPVYRDAANDNLFGSYRYKNEQFLRNHLKVAGGEQDPTALARTSTLKGYYLQDRLGEDEPQAKDREKEIALAIIKKVKSVRSSKTSGADVRAMHWLGLAGPEVSSLTTKYSREVAKWLHDKQKVAWEDQGRKSDPVLKIEVEKDSFPQKVSPGMDISIRWRIENMTTQPVGRVSVFARSHQFGIDTKEALVGRMLPGDIRTGSFKLVIPSNWEEDTLTLRVGGAIDAWPISAPPQELVAEVIPREVAKLSTALRLVQETGGQLPGVLEASEKARIEVEVTNSGPMDLSRVDLRAHNLSGRQIAVQSRGLTIDKLKIGEMRKLHFDVDVSPHLISSSLNIGISLSGRDLTQPEFLRLSVPGQPRNVRNTEAAISH